MSMNPKRDARIIALLRRGLMPKEVAFKLKLKSVGVVYEVVRRGHFNIYVLRRERRLQECSQSLARDKRKAVR